MGCDILFRKIVSNFTAYEAGKLYLLCRLIAGGKSDVHQSTYFQSMDKHSQTGLVFYQSFIQITPK